MSGYVLRYQEEMRRLQPRSLFQRIAISTMSTHTFISYSQDSPTRSKQALDLAQRLRADGIDAKIDQLEPHPSEGWMKWMEMQIRSANYILVAPSDKYKNEFDQVGRAKSGSRYEGSILSNLFYNGGASYEKIAIVLMEKDDKNYIPQPFVSGTYYEIFSDQGYERLYRWLTNQPEVVAAPLGVIRSLGPQTALEQKKNSLQSSFQILCEKILPLMRENKRIFSSFAPNSNANDPRSLRTNFEVWESKKRDSILPNNKLISTAIRQYYNDIPEHHRDVFDRMLSHVDAFEVHVIRGGAWYRDNQFPAEMEDIVKAQIKHD